MDTVNRGGQSWRVGTTSEVEWIDLSTEVGLSITSAIPPVFADYATITVPHHEENAQPRHDQALINVLKHQPGSQLWWLGYLDRGCSDVVFADAPKVRLYAGWPYVLVQAGAAQAAAWRQAYENPMAPYRLPDLIFPSDQSWLISTLWDDDWACVGGPASLIDALLDDPDLAARTRRVDCDVDATPPGHLVI